MIYDTGNVVIAAPSVDTAREQLLQYGVYDVAYPDNADVVVLPQIKIVTTYAEAVSELAGYPADTKWVHVGTVTSSLFSVLFTRFGQSTRMPDAIRALNDEFAINPRALQR